MSSFFYLQAEKTQRNYHFIDAVSTYCEANKIQAYILDRPLGDGKYSYSFRDGLVLLIPKHKITFINFSTDIDEFQNYVEEFIEDLGSISDKFRYKDAIGRPRSWRAELVEEIEDQKDLAFPDLLQSTVISNAGRQRICELLISLLTGSINDIEKVRAEEPQTLLDKVKQKILLFDGDQTRFVYQHPTKSCIRIQGLSGTGKTELLLHKLKEIYVTFPECKIAFTCHNKILADSLKRRIPEFFNFMKVEQQIQWDERLWCTHAWGSLSDANSGIYRYICEKYGITFQRYSRYMSFDQACKMALEYLAKNPIKEKAFDFCLIDESQDFPDSFFELCKLVTDSTTYIAGDVFQSIFDENIRFAVAPDYLLTKCYRTDPKTLMFAHALGMGLFEPKKLRWLEDPEWAACGYLVEKDNLQGNYLLKREPLRRFEDVDRTNVPSVIITKIDGSFQQRAVEQIISCIAQIKKDNPTVTVDDIGVILLDPNDITVAMADTLNVCVPRLLGWKVNIAYETKRRIKDTLFVSNKNNVKGLEFPFVICVTRKVTNSYSYRNSIYMTLTRSFIQTYLILSNDSNAGILPLVEAGLNAINATGRISVRVPTQPEKDLISSTIKYSAESESFFDMSHRIFEELNVLPIYRENLLDAIKKLFSEEFEYERLREAIEFNYNIMQGD